MDDKVHMISSTETELNKLSMKQQWFLQKLYKRRDQGVELSGHEVEIAGRFEEQWQVALKHQKSKRPIIVMVIVSVLLGILYREFGI